jgi:hypothetical protein
MVVADSRKSKYDVEGEGKFMLDLNHYAHLQDYIDYFHRPFIRMERV